MLLFPWPPACEVWLNYEVVLFQTCSETAPSLGSVSNITSDLKPAHRSTVYCIFSPPSVAWPPLQPTTLKLSCTTILAPNTPTSLLVLDCLTTWTCVHHFRPPTEPSTLSVLSHSIWSPGPSHPLQPRAASLFLPSLPLFFRLRVWAIMWLFPLLLSKQVKIPGPIPPTKKINCRTLQSGINIYNSYYSSSWQTKSSQVDNNLWNYLVQSLIYKFGRMNLWKYLWRIIY